MVANNWCPDPVPPPQKDPNETQSIVDISFLCENGWQPLLITGFLRDILVRQWANPQNIIAPEMQQYLWRETPDSGILIESVHRYRADLIGKRPAIMIKRNTFKSMPLGFAGQIFGGGFNAFENEKGAITAQTTLFVGSHTLFCIHDSGAATEILATEVMTYLTSFSLPIRRELGLRQFAVAEVGDIQELEESSENYVVPITVGWGYEFNWAIHDGSLPLGGISLTSFLGENGELALATAYQGP